MKLSTRQYEYLPIYVGNLTFYTNKLEFIAYRKSRSSRCTYTTTLFIAKNIMYKIVCYVLVVLKCVSKIASPFSSSIGTSKNQDHSLRVPGQSARSASPTPATPRVSRVML